MMEEDTCRICGAPAEADQPLFHPCKCSGTIRYIHQDCLTTWLAHSKKKSCDVCKFEYAFTKVYAPQMPAQLPVVLFLRRLARQVLWLCLLGMRGVMVITIWLVLLPYVTVWTWRLYFFLGNYIAWWINDRPNLSWNSPLNSYSNITASILDPTTNTTSESGALFSAIGNYPIWRALSSDIFTGQIIASLIVLVFLGVFLLREWIVQNARPGVFEDNDGIPGEQLPPDPQVVEPQPQPQPLVIAPMPPPPIFPPVEHANDAEAQERPPSRKYAQAGVMTSDGEGDTSGVDLGMSSSRRRSMKRHHSALEGRDRYDYSDDSDINDPPRLRRRTRTFQDADDLDYPFDGRIKRPLKGKGRAFSYQSYSPNLDSSTLPNTGHEFSYQSYSPNLDSSTLPNTGHEFTFNSKPDSEPAIRGESDFSTFSFAPPPDSEKLFNYEPSASLPYPIDPFPTTPSSSTSSRTSPVRRPPLPTSATLIPSQRLNIAFENGSPGTFAGPSRINDDFPLLSPGLAIYNAPEELEDDNELPVQTAEGEGSSSAHAVAGAQAPSNLDEDVNHYFREAYEEESVDASTETAGDVAGLAPDSDEEDWDDRHEILDDHMHHPNVEAVAVAPQGQDEARPAQEGNEEMDANIDDDMDGALEEAIGMRGPITTVFQNAALMIFALDTAIGLGVWLPFTVGKTSALLVLEPYRFFELMHLPIRVIRVITDPIVDLCFLLIRKFVLPLFLRTLGGFGNSLLGPVRMSYDKLSAMGYRTDMSTETRFWNVISPFFKDSATRTPPVPIAEALYSDDSPVMQFVDRYFASLGAQVRVTGFAMREGWTDLANGDAPLHRVFSIVLGYAVFGVMLAVYLNILNVGSVKSAGRAVRSAIRQQLIVLKVAAFIVIELVIFPLGCGVMLDLCTLDLFPNTSLRSRGIFFMYAPVTATFYHWMIGTMFMYQFAILLAGCRSIMRPGAMWFIKDPQDQNFHPIRDILDRPTLLQLRKLAVSAVMYSMVVACGMGSVVFFFRFWGKGLIPLRWKMREPLSQVPIDLLFLHLVLPKTLQYFRPRKTVRAVTTYYWRWAAHQLQLTSYMFGGRYPDEENPHWLWVAPYFSKGPGVAPKTGVAMGTFRRVPADDNIALPKDLRATVAVNADGEPFDESGRRLLETQRQEAEKAKRDFIADYTVVYMPPNFKWRIIIFIAGLWLVGSMICVGSVALPIRIGRSFFARFLTREVHDGYSFVMGFYLLWGCFVVGKTLDRMDRRRQRVGGDGPRADWPLYIAKRAFPWAVKVLWMLFWMGVVIPTLLAIVVEVYLILPLRLIIASSLSTAPAVDLKIRIVECWAVGLLYANMAISTMRLRPPNRLDAAITHLLHTGWKRPDAVSATLDIIMPVTGGLIAMLLAPPGLVFGIQRLTMIPPNDRLLFLYVYPGIFTIAAVARMCATLVEVCGSWAQSIRDSEFLLEMRLRNLEQPQRTQSAPREVIHRPTPDQGAGLEGEVVAAQH